MKPDCVVKPDCVCVQVRHSVQVVNQDPPATSDDMIVAAVAASAKELGLSTKHMVSRAYHDSLYHYDDYFMTTTSRLLLHVCFWIYFR